ncbi:MAG: bifunctional demethylmenaquinone methyltransferase/2-methoxy-6-polyprenyl-1,4-benzoquinol methylase UbiE [Flavobacteriaceae bacterium]|nr:bifunctional demethylmenaquinone methyltransferase/2-methoxy-6-polyprenyl-1,4-benzoquinol methylase UbiE [Flavobacteriaceae bacterium]
MAKPSEIKPYTDTDGKKEQVSKMFDTISKEYDFLNKLITFGLDKSWKRKLVQKVIDAKPNRVLDIATGTGDLVIAMAKSSANELIGLDISKGMLAVGEDKVRALNLQDRITMQWGDVEQMPFEDNSFDVVVVSYGVRNFEDLELGLNEIFRCLKPGGQLMILETSRPDFFPMRQLHSIYTRFFMPLIANIFSKDKSAYVYLAKSAANFPYGKAFNNILAKIRFNNVESKPQFFGVSTLYYASK